MYELSSNKGWILRTPGKLIGSPSTVETVGTVGTKEELGIIGSVGPYCWSVCGNPGWDGAKWGNSHNLEAAKQAAIEELKDQGRI